MSNPVPSLPAAASDASADGDAAPAAGGAPATARGTCSAWLCLVAPATAALLLFVAGGAFFVQKDHAQRSARQAHAGALAQAQAREIAQQVAQARAVVGVFAALMSAGGDSRANHRTAEALLHNHPDISTLRVQTADYGGQSFHNGRLGAVAEPGQELRPDADAEVQPVGPTTLALTGEAIEVRQTLHAHRLQRGATPAGSYFGEVLASIPLNTLAARLTRLQESGYQVALVATLLGDDRSPARAVAGDASLIAGSGGAAIPPDALAIDIALLDESAGLVAPARLRLALEPAAGWQGSPFLPTEIALSAVAALLAGIFLHLLLSQSAAGRAAVALAAARDGAGPDAASADALQSAGSPGSGGSLESASSLRLAARVFENSSEGIIITDAANRILLVNQAFTHMTGYEAAEVIGRNPRLLGSGKQSPMFYKEMWESIQRRGEWHGEVQNRRKNGEFYSEWLTISAVRDRSGETTNYVAVFSDITSKKQIAERLNFLANYDTLTSLPNRVLFTDRLAQALNAARAAGRHAAVLWLDLDRFSLVNETFGHAAGDQLLREIARRLCRCVREGDSVSRVGGDEFAIVLAGLESPDDAALTAGKIMQAMATPLEHDGQEIYASASIGISVFPDDGDDADTLVKNANSAMYRAMEEGRNTFRFYHQQMNARSSERLSLHSDLHRALERGELVMHYQPLVEAQSGRIVGAEALLRWYRPGTGFITPTAFIPLLEETGLIVPVGEWALASACEDSKRWRDHGHRELFVAVNFSALQLGNGNVARQVADTLGKLSVDPRHLEIELTESAVMHDTERCIRSLHGLKEIGARLSVDDFGTGYSSLAYLKQLPIDTLKIDRSFVADAPGADEAEAIVHAIVAMGHSLGLRIVAEGVQQRGQVDFMRAAKCDLLQGFYFSTALPQEAFLQLLAAQDRERTFLLPQP